MGGSYALCTHNGTHRAALDAKKPLFLFLAPDDFPIPANLLEPMAKIVAEGFASPADLAQKIVTSVYNETRPETALVGESEPPPAPVRALAAVRSGGRRPQRAGPTRAACYADG
jgi:hypothetical protein